MSLKKLLILQHHDQQLLALERGLKRLPQQKRAEDQKKEDLANSIATLRHTLQEKERGQQRLAAEVMAKEETLAKYRRQQMETRSNEEYTALEEQIRHLTGVIRGLEEEELAVMGEIEELQASLPSKKEEVAVQVALIEKGILSLKQQYQQYKKRKEEQLEVRKKVAAELDPHLLEEYQHLFRKKEGTALVPLLKGTCGGCHMTVPRQTILSVESEKGMHHCDYCGRWLYLEG
jgi:uncharacterized protein